MSKKNLQKPAIHRGEQLKGASVVLGGTGKILDRLGDSAKKNTCADESESEM